MLKNIYYFIFKFVLYYDLTAKGILCGTKYAEEIILQTRDKIFEIFILDTNTAFSMVTYFSADYFLYARKNMFIYEKIYH